MIMKKINILFLLLILVFTLCMFTGCEKKEETITATVAPVETPEPTKEPDTVSFALATPSPVPVFARDLMKAFIISDADVDAVMTEDVENWEGWKVFREEYEGQVVYYPVPDENAVNTEKAVGSVYVNLNNDFVENMSIRVFVNSFDSDPEKTKEFYEYVIGRFPMDTIASITEDAWNLTKNEIDMTYDHVLSEVQAKHQQNVICGSFVFHIGDNNVGFDFYAK